LLAAQDRIQAACGLPYAAANNLRGGGSGKRSADNRGRRIMPDSRDGDVLVQICLECGKEYLFDLSEPGVEAPDDLVCAKCGSVVFRSYTAAKRPDDVEEDFRETTDRDTATDDPATDVTRGDLQDLGNF